MIRLPQLCFASLLLILLGVPVAAQSGSGGLSGLVLRAHSEHPGYPQNWDGDTGTDKSSGPTVRLTPIATHMEVEAQSQLAVGRSGRFEFGPVPMGLYLLRAEAPGHKVWEAEIYVPSDTLGKVYILLQVRRD